MKIERWIVAFGAVGKGWCDKEEFACRTSKKCMNLSFRCDGNKDCADGSDESSCQTCSKDAFFCYIHTTCISSSLKCNGDSDCGDADGADERSCDACTNGFLCKKDRKCIPTRLQCDGYEDCSDSSDENSCDECSKDVILCRESRQCIVQSSKCDGHPDCSDGSDETSCDCIRPSLTTGVKVPEETNLTFDSFQVTVECKDTYTGTLTVEKCEKGRAAYKIDGTCTAKNCIRPSLTTGVKMPEEANLTFDSFQVSAECDEAYTGTLLVTKCDQGGSAYKIGGTCIPKRTLEPAPSTAPTPASSASSATSPMRRNLTALTVLTLQGALPTHGEVCQHSHPLIQTIRRSMINWIHATLALDILVVGVTSIGQKHRCTDSGGMRLRRSLRGVENQILLIEYVLFVSSLTEQNPETIVSAFVDIVSSFSGDDVDVTREFADVSDDYIVVSAITTITALEDKERYFLDAASVTPEPHEPNNWVYVICVAAFLLIVSVACSAYRRCAERDTSEPSTLQIHDASVYMRDIADITRGDESHARRAREFLVRRTPSMPVHREALENTSDSGSIYSIVSDSVPEAIADSSSMYSIVSDSIPAPVSDDSNSVYSIYLPDFSSATKDRQL